MREIEIKARITDKNSTLAALRKLNIELSKPKKQHDVVYCRPGAENNVAGENWLRIRTEDDKHSTFTLKRSVSGGLDKIEHETAIDNAAEMTTIIGYLGYELFSDLTKVRQKANYGDIEICLDEVAGLGSFIEAEKLCAEDANYDAVAAELWALFEKLGISKGDEVTIGYDIMMHKLQQEQS